MSEQEPTPEVPAENQEPATVTTADALAKHNAGEELSSADVFALEHPDGTTAEPVPDAGAVDAPTGGGEVTSTTASSSSSSFEVTGGTSTPLEPAEPAADASDEEKESYLARLEEKAAAARERLFGSGGAL